MQGRLEERATLPWRPVVGSSRSRSGQLIVLEGADGAGKTSIGREAVRQLKAEGVPATFSASPGIQPGSVGELVHRLSYRPADLGVTEDVDPLAVQLLHVAAHIDAIPRIAADMSAGRVVVLDRCWWSTWVYGTVTGVAPNLLRAALRLEAEIWRDTRPSQVFLLERRSNDEFQPPGLMSVYRQLALEEAEIYPVTVVRNDSTVAAAAAVVVEGALARAPLVSKASSRSSQESSERVPELKHQRDRTRAKEHGCAEGSELDLPSAEGPVFDSYWRLAVERQRIFFKRLRGEPPPWTSDEVLSTFRFTNAYRASDRVSQYLIRHVIYGIEVSPEDTVFRILLFKLFNRIDTWQHLERAFGEIRYQDFSVKRFSKALARRAGEGGVYSAAYIMPPPGTFGFERKYENHLALLNHMMRDRLSARLARARSLRETYEALASYPGLGRFLAYQYAIDLNYSELIDFSESEFVVAGPGAKKGIRKCFGPSRHRQDEAVIAAVCDRQEREFDTRALQFENLWGRPLQWIDCQNLFCEIDKYSRMAHPEFNKPGKKVRIKQRYVPGGPVERPYFPPKWGINGAVERWYATHANC